MTPYREAFESVGNNKLIMQARDLEVLAEGPAGTGKTLTILAKLVGAAQKYPGMRGAIVRKTRTSMTQTVLQTMEDEVLDNRMKLHTIRQSYVFPNGSEIVVGGMDKPDKILSSGYDIIFINEGTEFSVVDYETLLTRLRHAVMPYQQMIVDCNPGPSQHWLNLRAIEGRVRRIRTFHKDNPALWDGTGWTERGRQYIDLLKQNLTGLRFKRYYEGIWATAEGVIYDTFDYDRHIIDPFPIPDDWERFRVIDFGYSNPFVCQWWAKDHDGRLYMYREIYMTGRTVRTHALQIKQIDGDGYIPTIADHDAEDRATLAENGIETSAAIKDVTAGIDRVHERLKVQGDGKPRLFLFRDALHEMDYTLRSTGRPTSTAGEFGSYTWKETSGNIKDEPQKVDDHGMDAMRYMVMHLDSGQNWLMW